MDRVEPGATRTSPAVEKGGVATRACRAAPLPIDLVSGTSRGRRETETERTERGGVATYRVGIEYILIYDVLGAECIYDSFLLATVY